jgi:hypothetical protein
MFFLENRALIKTFIKQSNGYFYLPSRSLGGGWLAKLCISGGSSLANRRYGTVGEPVVRGTTPYRMFRVPFKGGQATLNLQEEGGTGFRGILIAVAGCLK